MPLLKQMALAEVSTPPAQPYRFYQCTLPNNPDMVWKCVHTSEKEFDKARMFTGIGYSMANYQSLTTSFSSQFYDDILKNGCLASRKKAQPVILNIGVKSWVPASMDHLFVAANLPGGVVFEKNK